MSRSDFDNDGFDDLAIGVVGETIGTLPLAGAANVLYGSVIGLSATGDQFWHQNSANVEGSAEQEDFFGGALASGDFDDDGYDDLAIGVPGEDVGSGVAAGAANVLYGSVLGLSATGDALWHQDRAGVGSAAEEGDFFGNGLAVGDFDDDGFDDLAVGVPGESVGSLLAAGATNVLYGSSLGLTATGSDLWHQNSANIESNAEEGDFFGGSLASGDFDDDGYDDLAIGAPGEGVGSIAAAGAVNVLRGSADGLTATEDRIWHQNSANVESSAEEGDSFGSALAVGDFDRDGYDDLAIGIPDEDVGAVVDAGAVSVLHGSAAGLTAAGDQLWHQDRANVESGSEQGDLFGSALATGDFDDDGFDDLAIGVSGEGIGSVSAAGAVSILYGSAAGLTAAGDQLWHQDRTNVEGGAQADDGFGSALTVGDFNNDGVDDLAIGVPGEGIGSILAAGGTNVLYGSENGLSASGDDFWYQDSPGISGASGDLDLFGFVLA